MALVIVQGADLMEQDVYAPDGTKASSKGDKNESIVLHTFVKQNNVWRIASTQITPVIADSPMAKAAAKGN